VRTARNMNECMPVIYDEFSIEML